MLYVHFLRDTLSMIFANVKLNINYILRETSFAIQQIGQLSCTQLLPMFLKLPLTSYCCHCRGSYLPQERFTEYFRVYRYALIFQTVTLLFEIFVKHIIIEA